MPGWECGLPRLECGTPAHLRPPQRALRHKMAAGAGRAQARGGWAGLITGATPTSHMTGCAGSGGPGHPPSHGHVPRSRHRTQHPCALPRKAERHLPPLPELPRQQQGAGFSAGLQAHCGLTTGKAADQAEFRDQ